MTGPQKNIRKQAHGALFARESGLLDDVIGILLKENEHLAEAESLETKSAYNFSAKDIYNLSVTNRALRRTVHRKQRFWFGKGNATMDTLLRGKQRDSITCKEAEELYEPFYKGLAHDRKFMHKALHIEVKFPFKQQLGLVKNHPNPVLVRLMKRGVVDTVSILRHDRHRAKNYTFKLTHAFDGLRKLVSEYPLDLSGVSGLQEYLHLSTPGATKKCSSKSSIRIRLVDAGTAKRVDVIGITFEDVTGLSKVECAHIIGSEWNGIFRENIWIEGTIVKDVSSLRNLKELYIQSYKLTDVSALANIKRLRIETPNVMDVSMLGQCDMLVLAGCRGVHDVSALGGVRELNLHSCTSVTDVSMLGGVHRLNLSRCHRLTDLSMIGDVKVKEGWRDRNTKDVFINGKHWPLRQWVIRERHPRAHEVTRLQTRLTTAGYPMITGSFSHIRMAPGHVNDDSTPFDELWGNSI